MTKQKLLVVFLALIMAFSLIACSKKADDSDPVERNGKEDGRTKDVTEKETTEESKTEKSEKTKKTEVEKTEDAKETEVKESETAKETEATESETSEETDVVESEETEDADTDQVADGEIFETEEFSVSVPEGWVTPPAMEGEESTNKVSLFKGGMEDPMALLKAPVINLEYGDSGIPLTKMDKKFYDGAEDIDPIEIGGKSFSGFTAKSSDLPMTCLYAEDGDKQYQIFLWTEKPGGTISLEDADVIQIIESFQGK
ncbi:MAG: hypothetical protein GX328_01050 [Clostridiaceae bacterium]|nr:hypothetical protein [Clostridiaceae bacterium]